MTEQDWARFNAKEWAMGHEELCRERWKSSDEKMTLVIRILFSLIATIVVVSISFTGYTYVQGQAVAAQLYAAQQKENQTLQQLPSRTAQAITTSQQGN